MYVWASIRQVAYRPALTVSSPTTKSFAALPELCAAVYCQATVRHKPQLDTVLSWPSVPDSLLCCHCRGIQLQGSRVCGL